MTLRRFLPLVLIALGFACLQADSQAGDKDKKDKEKAKAVELKLKDGQATVNASLVATDPVYVKAAKKHKLYVLNMEEGKTYQIDMISKDFETSKLDPYLFLEGPDDALVARDDDGGGFPHARIVYKAAKTGSHHIICTYFGGQAVGDFTLKVSQTDK